MQTSFIGFELRGGPRQKSQELHTYEGRGINHKFSVTGVRKEKKWARGDRGTVKVSQKQQASLCTTGRPLDISNHIHFMYIMSNLLQLDAFQQIGNVDAYCIQIHHMWVSLVVRVSLWWIWNCKLHLALLNTLVHLHN